MPNGLEALFFWSLSFASMGTLISRFSLIKGVLLQVLPLIVGWIGLFALMTVSLLWSPWEQGAQVLFEYRVLLISGLVTLAVVLSRIDYLALIRMFWFAGLVGIVSLFLKHGGIFDGQLHDLRPRGSHIIGGLVSSAFVVISLTLFMNNDADRLRPLFVIMSLLASVEVLFLEIGRTGIIQISAVWFCFGYLSYENKKRWLWPLIVTIFLAVILFLSSEMQSGLARAYQNAKFWSEGDHQYSSVGARLEWIAWSFSRGVENIFFGVGVGNYLAVIQSAYESGDVKFFTDNLHSEVANIFLMTGAIGSCCFVSHFLMIIWSGNRSKSRETSFLATGMVVIFLLHSIANSTFKDFGEKNLLVAILPLVVVYVLKARDRVLSVQQ